MKDQKPVAITQKEFMALLGMPPASFHRNKKTHFPDPIRKIGQIVYYRRAEVEAFICGEWSKETAEQWRKEHRAEILGELPLDDDREAA
ncbi:MAG: hypothetical protein P1R74_00775 [Sedimenticola sp.]|nr:hypothetical protein [Sedimenticola sp.]